KQLISLHNETYQQYRQKKLSSTELQNSYVTQFGDQALKLFQANSKEFETKELQGYVQNEKIINFIRQARGYTMFIWSSNSRAVIDRVLNELGILERFSKIVTREDVSLLKPSLEGFSKLYVGNSKTKYLFIGDSKNDKAAADKFAIDFYMENHFYVPGKYW